MSDSNSTLTAERLRTLLEYNQETGLFVWLQNVSSTGRIGRVTGTSNNKGHLQIMIDGRRYQAHRLAWLYVHGVWPVNQIDHIDGQRANNRIQNLRDVTNAVNQQNLRRAKISNKLGLLGVKRSRNGEGFIARIHIGNRDNHIGTFKTPELAHEAYLNAKRILHEGCTI